MPTAAQPAGRRIHRIGSVVACAAWLLATLLQGTAHAYTINATERGRSIRWASDQVTFRVDPKLEAALPEGETRASIAIAFEAWRGFESVPDIRLVEGAPNAPGYTSGPATNGLFLLDDWPYEAEKLALTVVTYEVETGRLLDADILVNAQVPFHVASEEGGRASAAYDLPAVLTHEAGHVLGLGESMDQHDATMWPYARMGDTHQRTLAEDDERGILEAYSGPPPGAVGGCGGLRAAGGRGPSGAAPAVALLLLACLGALRLRGRAGRPCAAAAVVLTLVVGGGEGRAYDDPSERIAAVEALSEQSRETMHRLLADAAHDASPEVRLAVLRLLERAGDADHRALAATLASDAEPQVAALAARLSMRLPARAPARQALAHEPDARARLSRLFGDHGAAEATIGTAREAATDRVEGLLWTRYRIDGAPDDAALRVPGGVLDGVAQRVGETPRPVDGAEVLVIRRGGAEAWAYHHEGLLFGGHLGDGPAISGAL